MYRMVTTTITLERSAYELLKANKRPGESFSEEVQRVLGADRPSLRGFLDLFTREDAQAIGKVIGQMRREEIALERNRLDGERVHHGRSD